MRKQSKIIFYAGIVLGVAAVLTGVALSGGEKIPQDFTHDFHNGLKIKYEKRYGTYHFKAQDSPLHFVPMLRK